MTQRRIRRVAAAAALAMVLAFTAPAHAVDWQTWTGEAGWLDRAVQWMVRLWVGEDGGKIRKGVDPNGEPQAVTPPPPPDAGHGIDPNG